MGLLDKLFKKGASILKDAAEGKVSELFGKKEEEERREEPSPATAPVQDAVSYEEPSCREKILRILNSEFPDLSFRENVSARELGGTGRFMDYSIAVYKEGRPKLMIMIIGKTTTLHREYRWAREFAEKNAISFINFIEHYPNEPEYVSKRLHSYLD